MLENYRLFQSKKNNKIEKNFNMLYLKQYVTQIKTKRYTEKSQKMAKFEQFIKKYKPRQSL